VALAHPLQRLDGWLDLPASRRYQGLHLCALVSHSLGPRIETHPSGDSPSTAGWKAFPSGEQGGLGAPGLRPCGVASALGGSLTQASGRATGVPNVVLPTKRIQVRLSVVDSLDEQWCDGVVEDCRQVSLGLG
jgi:hypothetical protein